MLWNKYNSTQSTGYSPVNTESNTLKKYWATNEKNRYIINGMTIQNDDIIAKDKN